MKIVHITTVHQRFDSRIFYKECISLKSRFDEVTLIVADGKGNQYKDGIRIIDVGLYPSRIKRLLFASERAIKTAASLNADVYHFHDPDLLLGARTLCKHSKVIFDSHEDFPLLMLQRPYIPKPLRRILFAVARRIEINTYTKLAGVITATDNIRNKFLAYERKYPKRFSETNKTISVKNYPIIHADEPLTSSLQPNADTTATGQSNDNAFTACYVGGLTQIRGVRQMIDACEQAQIRLILAGPFDDEDFFSKMRSLPAWNKYVTYLGVVPHDELQQKVYSLADVGLNMLLAAPNHTDSLPIKQLEYMAQGLPVIATEHVKFCKEVTALTGCGILVRPENTKECANALLLLKNNPQTARTMGQKGKTAALNVYNWEKEKEKLIEFYLHLQSD